MNGGPSCYADSTARTCCSLSGPQDALRKETEVSLNGNGGTALTQSERNLGHRWFELVWNQGRRDAIAQLLAPDALLHDGSGDSCGPEAFYPLYDRLSATFSKIHVDVHDALAEGGKVCVRWTFTGTHTGDGLGVAPTGVTVNVTGICILRVAGDRIVEGWQNWDMMGMREQITGVARSLATYIG